jgi:hypothetical protein
MASTCISRHMNVPRARVYKALIDVGAIAKWKVPTGMTCPVHEFEGREGGAFRDHAHVLQTPNQADAFNHHLFANYPAPDLLPRRRSAYVAAPVVARTADAKSDSPSFLGSVNE